MKTWVSGGGPETGYGYDGEGRRVTGSGVDYVGVDHLGSTRVVVGADGRLVRRMDYRPFGAELSGVDSSWRTAGLGFVVDGRVRGKFTGKERDAETGLDYFGARYMSAAQGRFTSGDPFLGSGRPEDPQSWNRYAYARNNPLVAENRGQAIGGEGDGV